MYLVADPVTLWCVAFGEHLPAHWHAQYPLGTQHITGISPAMTQFIGEIEAYTAGTRQIFTTPYRIWGGTPFQQRVWQALLQIPYGTRKSYGELAQSLGIPGGSQAIGQANKANRLALRIPCHRVIRTNGDTGGFRGGTDVKIALLAHETRFD